MAQWALSFSRPCQLEKWNPFTKVAKVCLGHNGLLNKVKPEDCKKVSPV